MLNITRRKHETVDEIRGSREDRDGLLDSHTHLPV